MFKNGDLVTCLESNCNGSFVKGEQYLVKDTYTSLWKGTNFVTVNEDEHGDVTTWAADKFELYVEPIKEPMKEPAKEVKVNYHLLDSSLVLNYGGKTQVIQASDERFPEAVQAIQEGRLQDIPEIVEIERRYDGDGIKLKDGLFVAGNETLPAELEDRIIKYRASKLPYDSLLKFWENLKKNPSFNSRKQLFAFLAHNGHPLTEDGCFIAYRGVTEDFKDLHTKTFDNKPGSVCEMPRSEVDENPNNTCSSGLHVACFDYAKGFGPKLIEVKVNPADVVAVPTDYNGTKMRVCRFEVVQEGEKPREEVVYHDDCDSEVDSYGEDCCQNCGEEIDGFSNYCSECGEQL